MFTARWCARIFFWKGPIVHVHPFPPDTLPHSLFVSYVDERADHQQESSDEEAAEAAQDELRDLHTSNSSYQYTVEVELPLSGKFRKIKIDSSYNERELDGEKSNAIMTAWLRVPSSQPPPVLIIYEKGAPSRQEWMATITECDGSAKLSVIDGQHSLDVLQTMSYSVRRKGRNENNAEVDEDEASIAEVRTAQMDSFFMYNTTMQFRIFQNMGPAECKLLSTRANKSAFHQESAFSCTLKTVRACWMSVLAMKAVVSQSKREKIDLDSPQFHDEMMFHSGKGHTSPPDAAKKGIAVNCHQHLKSKLGSLKAVLTPPGSKHGLGVWISIVCGPQKLWGYVLQLTVGYQSETITNRKGATSSSTKIKLSLMAHESIGSFRWMGGMQTHTHKISNTYISTHHCITH